jgi:hypothetical protein
MITPEKIIKGIVKIPTFHFNLLYFGVKSDPNLW